MSRCGVALGGALLAMALVVRPAWAEPQPQLSFERPGEVRPGQPFEIEFRAANLGSDAQNGSITISFPGNPAVQVVAHSSLPANNSYAKLFEPGEQMFHFGQARNAPIQSRAAELFASSWPAGQEHFLRVSVTAQQPFSIQARATLRGARFDTDPPSGPPDQQGAPTSVVEIIPRVAAPPTPVPPTAVPPTPVPPTPIPATQDPVTQVPPTPVPTLPPTPTTAAPPGPAAAVQPTLAPGSAPLGAAAPAPPPGQQTVSLPLLLVGLAVLGLGIALGLLAVLLWTRRGSPQQPGYRETAPGPAWSPGGYAPYAGPAGQDRPPSPAGPFMAQAPWDPEQTGRPSPAPSPPRTPRPPTAAAFEDSPTLYDRYQDRTLVGQGGMGSVYRAYDSRLRRWVALKVMHADLSARPAFVERFMREAQTAAMLEHPNIVTVHDVEQLGDQLHIVMAWVDGQDLQKVLHELERLSPERTDRVLVQIAAALDHAHQQPQPVYHRDIKPANIMLAHGDRVVLTDFGIAKLIGEASLTGTGQFVGTPEYMAPEVIQGESADHRSDLYALGVVVYQMLTGRTPFHAETPLAILHAHLHTPPPPPQQITPTIPLPVEGVVLTALAKDPAKRFQSAGELAAAFSRAVMEAGRQQAERRGQ